MSSVGQAVGGVVGAVVGFFVGGPSGALYGAQIGMMAGGYLDPPKGPTIEGPRLDDLSVQTSTYGAVIPRCYGTIPTAGNVFWLENNKLKEKVKKTKSGGKGGGSKTTTKAYSYYATFAVGLCQGPIDGVRRIWIKDVLWYDAGTTDVDAVRASNQKASLFTLHDGSATQLPDDRMQATLGVDNTPAYRGLAYIVFKDLPLAEYGNSLLGAQVKVEVLSHASQATSAIERTLPAYGYWERSACTSQMIMAIDVNSTTSGVVSYDGITWKKIAIPESGYTNNHAIAAKDNETFAVFKGSSSDNVTITDDGGKTWRFSSITGSSYSFSCAAYGAGKYVVFPSGGNYMFSSEDGIVWTKNYMPSFKQWSFVMWNGETFLALNNDISAECHTSIDGINWVTRYLPTSVRRYSATWNGAFFLIPTSAGSVEKSTNGIDWSIHSTVNFNGSRSITWNGEYFIAAPDSEMYARISKDGITWTTVNVASPLILCWSSLVFDGVVVIFGRNTNRAITLTFYQSGSDETLSNIVLQEMTRSNALSVGDIDVSALAQSVRGYKISSVSALRSGIEPLQGAWPFDVVQHGYKILFKPRGSGSIATIHESDLDARGASDSPGVALTAVREMDSVLPRRVALSYIDVGREYDTGSQYAERLNTDSVNIQSVEMALVLTASEAAKITEVLLYLYWMERFSVSFSLPPSYNHLEPSDVITVQSANGTYSLRLTEITYTQDGRLECLAKYNSAATYVSTAQGVSGTVTNQTLAPIGNSVMALLDMPLMLDSSDQAGFVAALCGSNSAWPGGVIVRTDDAGQTWTEIQGFSAPGSVIGSAVNTIGVTRTDVIDTSSTLVVYLSQGELSSISELAVLNGANWFAYGAHGRWEVIAAKTCSLQSDGSYLMTDLLRGRRGTEWACGLHSVGDTVVLLDSSSVDFISTSIDSIGKSRVYRGVTSGKEIESASDVEFTYTGVNLECLSPVYLNGNRHPTTNDWALEWVRRTRVGGEWRDYVDATLGEYAESYEVDIYDAGYATLKRTITGLSTPAATYTSAQQVADFGSNQSAIYIKVYQISAVVGRGYPLTTSITR